MAMLFAGYRPEPEVLQEPSQAATSIRLPKITFLGAFLTLVLVIGFIAAATQVYSMFTYTLLRAQRAGSGGKVLRVELTVPGLKSETGALRFFIVTTASHSTSFHNHV